jgi:hypothetical protein
MAAYAAWHYSLDALPSVSVLCTGDLALRVIIGSVGAASYGRRQTVTVEFSTRSTGSGPWTALSTVTAQRIDSARYLPFDGRPPDHRGDRPDRTYTLTGQWATTFGNTYLEASTPPLAPGTEVRYTIRALAEGAGAAIVLGPYRVVVALPQFTLDDAIGGHYDQAHPPFDGAETAWCALETTPFFPPLPCAVDIGGRHLDVDPATVHALPPTPDGPQLPLIDWTTDRVTVSLRADPADEVTVTVSGSTVSTRDGGTSGTARVILEYFGIQNYNDLLEAPFSSPAGLAGRPAYQPARTYMQVTMRDELGIYSSRPDAPSTGVDGYSFGFDVHRRFDVPYELALNGGVLGLITHDCLLSAGWLYDDIGTLVDDVAGGLLHPTVAGFGSHRVTYYSAETNRRDIAACAALQRTVLGDSRPVFYPDSRLYEQKPETTQMFPGTGIEYMVLDGLTGYGCNAASAEPNNGAKGLDVGPNFLWQDRETGLYLLFIDDQFKDRATWDGSYARPKPALSLRRWFLRNALDPHLRGNLLVFGDDFEKLCGNGWFEGDGTHPKFFALLEWISADRPWLVTVTTTNLKPAVDCVGTIDVRTATDPLIGYQPGTSRLYYDRWYRTWYDYESFWTGGTLGEITDRVEQAVQCWPGEYHNELFETAWLAFLVGQHENAFNKQNESDTAPTRNPLDPEDFTVVEGLQIRNVLVWLNASVWAAWAEKQDQSAGAPCPTFVNGGPVHTLIDALRRPCTATGSAWDAAHWDADPLETYTLFNRKVLVLLDRNGGCAPFVFVFRNGRARTVSGTFKSYQYMSSDNHNCDGPVIQNTVWTPNHRYIGSDLLLDRGQRLISWADARDNEPNRRHELLLPFNFDAYDAHPDPASNSVTMAYTRSVPARTDYDQAGYTALLREDGAARRQGLTAGLQVWHPEQPFTKTFRLDGSRLTVIYHGAPDPLLIDNEFCVDLYGAVTNPSLLTRHPAPDSVTIRSSSGDAVRVGGLQGCRFTDASLTTDIQDAARKPSSDQAVRDFLQLHRVLTEAVQLERLGPNLSYWIEFDPN